MRTIQQENFIFKNDFNRDLLSKNYGDDLSFCHKMFSLFIETIPNEYGHLKSAISSKNSIDIFQIAHRIKSNFYWVGLDKCHLELQNLEALAKKEDLLSIGTGSDLLALINSRIELVKLEAERMNDYLSMA